MIIGSALDIVEYCGVPRFLFVDFPLGNPCGQPDDRAMQREIVAHGLEMLHSVVRPRTTIRSRFAWRAGNDWRDRYMEINDAERAKLARLGEERRAERQRLRDTGQVRTE